MKIKIIKIISKLKTHLQHSPQIYIYNITLPELLIYALQYLLFNTKLENLYYIII